MDTFEILEALNQITKEKNLDIEFVLETLESGLLLAAKKKFGFTDNITVKIDLKSGEIIMYATKKVVKEVSDKNIEIRLEEAKKIEPEVKKGSEINVPIGFKEFGRNAIIAAKQILIQRVREAERDKIFEEYKNRIGEIVTGNVQQIDKGSLIINLGKTEAIIPLKEQIQRERYRQGDRIRAFILDVQRSARGPQIILSRANNGFLERLFEMEVPEIFEKIIEIKAIAREPGERSKIAVSSIDDRVDPVGACVGVKGTRVQSVVRELNNERIDIVPWHPDPQIFATRALSPAKIVRIDVFDQEKSMTLVVEDDLLSLAIGKGGQNARLAAKLTGWKINILSESERKSTKKLDEGPKIVLSSLAGIGKKLEEKLLAAGIDSVQVLLKTKLEDLTKIEGVGKKKAEKLVELAKEYLTPNKTEEKNQNKQK
ncbi:MAG: transcription termination factor NusA [Candidatus Zixiibacteriota bacterium]